MFTTLIHSKKKLSDFDKYQVGDNTYIIPKYGEIFSEIEINGAGIINKKFVEHNKYYNKNEILNEADNYEELQFNMKGSVCLFTTKNNNSLILPDPLGGAVLYYYDSPAIKIFSNSVNEIKNVLSKLGIDVEVNFSYFLENIATGNGGLTESPYNNIYSIKQFHYVKIHQGNLTICLNKLVKEYIKKASTKSYNEILKNAYDEINENISIVSEYKQIGKKYAHLTGGFDSRLILGGILQSSNQEKYRFFCSGNKGTPDKDIFISLSKHFGLKQTNDSGQYILKYPRTFEEEVKWSLDFTSGSIKTINPNISKDGNIILSGGYGELLRSFYSRENIYSDFNSFNDIISSLWKNFNNSGLFNKNFKNRFTEKFRDVLNEGLELGFPEESILDYYYIAIRNRYFVGQISFFSSVFNSRFDPLYSCSIAIDSLFIPQLERNNNFLGLDLLREFNDELISLPFDTPRVTDIYQKSRGENEIVNFADNFNINSEEITFVEKPKDFNRPVATNEDIKKANKMKARLWQVLEMKNNQKEMKQIIKEIPEAQINANFNKDTLNNIIYKDINNRVDLRTLSSLYSNFIWLKNIL